MGGVQEGEPVRCLIERGGMMSDAGIRLVYCTTDTPATAREMSRVLLEERRIACANLLPGMRSLYRWRGEVEEAEETVLILKTTATQLDSLIPRVVELHPYECPAVLVLPVEAGNEAYFSWLRENTTSR